MGGFSNGAVAAVTGGTDSFDTASSLLTVDDLLRVETGDGHLTDPPLVARGVARSSIRGSPGRPVNQMSTY